MPAKLFPDHQIEYHTELNPDQIGHCLSETVLTDFSLFSRKPYYGSFTEASFSVQKTSSRFNQQGLSPRIEGRYSIHNGSVGVTLRLQAHPFLIGVLVVLGLPLVLFLCIVVPEVLTTGEIDLLLNGLVPAVVLYAAFRVLFFVQTRSDIRFWEQALQLRPRHG